MEPFSSDTERFRSQVLTEIEVVTFEGFEIVLDSQYKDILTIQQLVRIKTFSFRPNLVFALRFKYVASCAWNQPTLQQLVAFHQ